MCSAKALRESCQKADGRGTTYTILLPSQKSTRSWGMLFFYFYKLEGGMVSDTEQNGPCLAVKPL